MNDVSDKHTLIVPLIIIPGSTLLLVFVDMALALLMWIQTFLALDQTRGQQSSAVLILTAFHCKDHSVNFVSCFLVGENLQHAVLKFD
jgi:hypothetical protein